MQWSPALLALVPVACVVIAFTLIRLLKRWRLERLLQSEFPEEWRKMLTKYLPVYNRLPPTQREALQQSIKIFLQEKEFYGCAGLVITDEIRVCIAGEACLLLLGQMGPVYPKLQAILVYPTAFKTKRNVHQEDGTVVSAAHNLLGESWDSGRVILSWDDVQHGASDFTDGHNVVLHEFAHQLDSASGATNGAPPLRSNTYKTWSTVFSDNFEDLQRRAMQGQPTIIDTYGATNPAEFFAVATETFFERPRELFQARPALFNELKGYYKLDPRDWTS